MSKVMICGIDGYLGWSLAVWLTESGHQVCGIDNLQRRRMVRQCGSDSGIPILNIGQRVKNLCELRGGPVANTVISDVCSHQHLISLIEMWQPDAVVHLAEQPSAPYSMKDYPCCIETQRNNVEGTLSLLRALKEHPEIHLIKLATMGEYGTPQVPIPEGFFEHQGKRLLFPRSPGSYYHCTKVHDSVCTEMGCRIWNLRATDVMQGVVYGTSIPEMQEHPELATRFDFDETWGTAVNRFCAQAVLGLPLTPYGKGGQRRGFLPLADSMQCLQLLIEQPPEPGQYRIVNQLDEVYSVTELARTVQSVGQEVLGRPIWIKRPINPRIELEDHQYEVVHDILPQLGYKPQGDLPGTLRQMLLDLQPHAERIRQYESAIHPRTKWK